MYYEYYWMLHYFAPSYCLLTCRIILIHCMLLLTSSCSSSSALLSFLRVTMLFPIPCVIPSPPLPVPHLSWFVLFIFIFVIYFCVFLSEFDSKVCLKKRNHLNDVQDSIY